MGNINRIQTEAVGRGLYDGLYFPYKQLSSLYYTYAELNTNQT